MAPWQSRRRSEAAPRTSALFGVGIDVAAQLLTTAGDNPDRLRSEAALAHLCGVAPIPCLKRYIVRDVCTAQLADFTALTT